MPSDKNKRESERPNQGVRYSRRSVIFEVRVTLMRQITCGCRHCSGTVAPDEDLPIRQKCMFEWDVTAILESIGIT